MIKRIIVTDKVREERIENRLLFDEINDLKNVNLLCGGNGVGKSTLINCIKNSIISVEMDKSRNYSAISFINSENNYTYLTSARSSFTYADKFNPYLISKKLENKELSEGQGIMNSIHDFMSALEILPEENDTDFYLILIDEFDSGLSVDNIKSVMNKIKKIVRSRNDIQFFIAFNNYYCCEFFKSNIISMYDGTHIKFKDHKEYVNFICNKENKKAIRRK